MTTLKQILSEAEDIFKRKWDTRDGRKIPDVDALQLGNNAVAFNGTVLYADMKDSTGLVDSFKPWFAAEMYKAYLMGACRIVRENDGEITAFDGDRVMAVFIGDYKNSSAAKTALQINAYVHALNEAIKRAYPNTSYVLRQSVGVDTSDLFVAKTGIRNSNDLVWVGRAANYAAKLCALGDSTHPTYITQQVFSKLSENSKYGGTEPRKSMWEKTTWTEKGIVVYRSNWTWSF
jgi:class 3 adenylate cyclase